MTFKTLIQREIDSLRRTQKHAAESHEKLKDAKSVYDLAWVAEHKATELAAKEVADNLQDIALTAKTNKWDAHKAVVVVVQVIGDLILRYESHRHGSHRGHRTTHDTALHVAVSALRPWLRELRK